MGGGVHRLMKFSGIELVKMFLMSINLKDTNWAYLNYTEEVCSLEKRGSHTHTILTGLCISVFGIQGRDRGDTCSTKETW